MFAIGQFNVVISSGEEILQNEDHNTNSSEYHESHQRANENVHQQNSFRCTLLGVMIERPDCAMAFTGGVVVGIADRMGPKLDTVVVVGAWLVFAGEG